MFSKRVILDIINSLPNNYDPLDAFLIRFDLDDKIDIHGLSTSEIKKAIRKYLIANQGIKDTFGNDIVHQIVEYRINNFLGGYSDFNKRNKEFNDYPYLYKYLRYDGYDIENGKLIRTLPEDIDESKKEDEINRVMKKYCFLTSIGHLENAKSSYFNANYAALTGQLRTYVESLFIDMAKFIKDKDSTCVNIENITPTNATTAMQVLAKCSNPIIKQEWNEWDGGNKKTVIEGFWQGLHPMGSHPGLPDIDEAIYRFQLVLLVTYNLIKRFENSYT